MITRLKRSRAGFTLVELIVVIAILAILAGVAVPVYSGYVKKANEASDLQLLGAMNTAFASACAERGLTPTDLVATAGLTGEAGSMTVTGVSAVRRGGASLAAGSAPLDSAALNEAFLRYFGDNAKIPFKVYTSLGYDTVNGVFVDGAKEITAYYNGKPVTVTMAQVTAYQASAYAAIEVSSLLSTIDNVAGLAKDNLQGKTPRQVANLMGEDYVSWLTETFGVEDIEALSPEELANSLVLYVARSCDGMDEDKISFMNDPESGITALQFDPSVDLATTATIPFALMMAYANANADQDFIVTGDKVEDGIWCYRERSADEYVAKMKERWDYSYGAGSVYTYEPYEDDGITFYNFYHDGQPIYSADYGDYHIEDAMADNGYGDNYVGVFDPVTCQYDVYEVASRDKLLDYFNSSTANLTSSSDVTSMLMNFYTDSGFVSYMASDQASADLEGFMSAMSMINQNVSNINANELLEQGYYNESLIQMLQSILGN